MKKRMLAWLLTLAMLMCMLPMAALADEDVYAASEADNYAEAAAVDSAEAAEEEAGSAYDAAAAETTGASTNPFVDMTDSSAYYYEPVFWALDNGITSGTSSTRFSPDAYCTRAQVVAFLYRYAGEPAVSGSNPFTDVKSTDYFYDAVLWAVQNNITSGTSATTFSPNANCTRAQVVAFLHRYAGEPTVSCSNPFTDVKTTDYFYDAVLWAVQNNITSGTSATTFSPNANCTRAQVVTFLYRNAGSPAVSAPAPNDASSVVLKEKAVVGSYLKFGSYEQDNNTSNGKEQIEWLVLKVSGDKAMLISRYVLDFQPYHTSYKAVTWATCKLRTWLNSTFYNAAFTSAQQAQIQTTTVTAETNPDKGISGGNDTQDKVYLLNINEAKTYFNLSGNIVTKYVAGMGNLQISVGGLCTPTAYAKAYVEAKTVSIVNSAYYNEDGVNKNCVSWWLRTPGYNRKSASYINQRGQADTTGETVNYLGNGVRPVIWVTLS